MRFSGFSRPSKPLSCLGLAAALVFVAIGWLQVIPNAGVFGWIWTIGALVIAIYHVFNIVLPQGVPETTYDFASGQGNLLGGRSTLTVEERLAQPRALRAKGVVSEQEYQHQRQRILATL
ncbi:hypothetical protein QWI17_05870 [Gilvimarinus sp. SDUM040013]|uniref:SHOCT domain-containing protein n=1 Tax=Gilvimarinus gilvus TaxID=3058038 RepID=A0ABU4S353_9GAMM|nr:hypothetical protein [Gilvimarinus sp. SDUM040013]MDO3385366.1 hypothetical protein [Gilvimarinus sp. SDUM040013]MDX6850941.1 hypothetical protein [Gilvimarinus sp. SDUM040013]